MRGCSMTPAEQITAGNLTRIDITRPITISQEAVE